MERVRSIYEQVEETKRYILGGSLLQLCITLILLDNAVELMMHRELEEDFAFHGYRRPEYQPALDDWLKACLGPKYSDDERSEAEREFELTVCRPLVDVSLSQLQAPSENCLVHSAILR